MTAITALTAQNTVGVADIHPVAGSDDRRPGAGRAEDIGVDAVKIGMLGTAETVAAVREALDLLQPGTPVVIDPVMVAESGAVLLDEPARRAIVERAAAARRRDHAEPAGGPRAGGGRRPGRGARGDRDDAEALARALHALGPAAVVVTGGHRDEATDVFFDGVAARADPRRASSGRRCPRLGLHALLRARRPPRARATLRWRRRAPPARSPGRRCATGCAASARGPGPVDVFDLTGRAAEPARRRAKPAVRGAAA